MHRCANAATRTAPPARQRQRGQRARPAPGPTSSPRPAGTLPVSACRRPYDSRENMDVLGDCSRLDLPACRELAGRPRSVPFGRDETDFSRSSNTTGHCRPRQHARLSPAQRPETPAATKAVRLRALRGRPRSMPTRDPSHPHHHGHPHSSTVLMHVPAPSLSSIAHVFPLVLAPDSAPCRAPY